MTAAINISEIICSGCGGKIPDKHLKIKIQSIYKKINDNHYDFSIDIPVYCCNCLDQQKNVNGWALSMNPYYNMLRILAIELLIIFNGIRQKIMDNPLNPQR